MVFPYRPCVSPVQQHMPFVVHQVLPVVAHIHHHRRAAALFQYLYQAVKEIVQEVHDMEELPENLLKRTKTGGIRACDITEETLSKHMQTNFMPDPDLLIRTGGELRISNFLLWQIAYSELYFCDTYWPDFNEEDLHKAIASYQHRQRRFGKTEEQVEKK